MKKIMGIPVHGEVYEEKPETYQRPIEDLKEIFLDLLNDPNVHSFGWKQYTPYFNDGDVCEFGVSDPWIKTVDDAEEEDDDEYLEIGDLHRTLGNHDYVQRERTPEEIAEYTKRYTTKWNRYPFAATHTWDRVDREPKYPETMKRAEKLKRIQRYEYEYAMKQAFGDHARVTVTKDGFQIDEYDHD